METYSIEDWNNLVSHVYEIIMAEIDTATTEKLPTLWPKLIVMYEFFRLIRGEAFDEMRPNGLEDYQNNIYKQEGEIANKLKDLSEKLNLNDGSTKFNLEQMKKSFDPSYLK